MILETYDNQKDFFFYKYRYLENIDIDFIF